MIFASAEEPNKGHNSVKSASPSAMKIKPKNENKKIGMHKSALRPIAFSSFTQINADNRKNGRNAETAGAVSKNAVLANRSTSKSGNKSENTKYAARTI